MEEVLSQYQHYQQSQALQSAMDQQKQQNLLKQKAKNKTEIFHLLLNHNLKDLEIATFIEQMLEEKMITYQYSAKTLTNSILWLQAKPNPNYSEGLQQNNMTQSNGFSFNLAQQQQMQMQQMAAQYKYDNEFAMVYHNVDTFQQDYKRGYLQQEMQRLMKYKQMRISQGSNGFKVIVLFHGVYDSLFNNEPLGQETQGLKHNQFKDQTKKEQLRQDCMTGDLTVSKSEYDKFLIDLTITYQFDYIQLDSPIEVIEFLKEMHQSIVEKPHRKELSMYSRKGFKPGKKASMCGFKDPQSINYISMLMCIPGVSENKAIALARVFPTFSNLMEMLMSDKVDQKAKLKMIQDVEVNGSIGDKSKRMGKVLAERIYKTLRSADPKTQISGEEKAK